MQNKSVLPQRNTAHFRLCSLSGALSNGIRLTCLFGSFVFLQFTVLSLANHAGEGYLTSGQRDQVYYALQVFVILGFLFHHLFTRICAKNPKISGIRKEISYSVFGLFLICAAFLLFAGAGSLLYVIVSMTSALTLGIIGGAAHLRMSLAALSGAPVAKCMGIGSAAAVTLQYLLQIHWGITPLLPLFMLAALTLVIFLLPEKESVTAGREENNPERATRFRIMVSVLIAGIFVLFACFYNEYIHHLQIQSNYGAYNVYSWPRLMLVPGYLLFAFLGDKKKGRYVPITSLCVMLVALLNAVLIGNPDAHWLNMCLFYIAIAAFTSYYLLTFWRLAPGTDHPALWAPFGRIIDSGAVLLTGAIHLSSLPAAVVLGFDIAGIVLVILLMAISGDFNFSDPSAANSPGSFTANSYPDAGLSDAAAADPLPEEPETQVFSGALSEEEVFVRMQEQYDLTSRETELLRELVMTEDKQAVISERMNITVKTLQTYVTRIYRKTGITTRAGLMDLYHETRIRR